MLASRVKYVAGCGWLFVVRNLQDFTAYGAAMRVASQCMSRHTDITLCQNYLDNLKACQTQMNSA